MTVAKARKSFAQVANGKGRECPYLAMLSSRSSHDATAAQGRFTAKMGWDAAAAQRCMAMHVVRHLSSSLESRRRATPLRCTCTLSVHAQGRKPPRIGNIFCQRI